MTVRAQWSRLPVLLALLSLGTAAPPVKPIQLRLETTTCRAPCSVTATVTISPHAANRHASVVWGYADSDGQHWEIEPGTAQTEWTVRIPDLAPGTHAIFAVLLRESDGRAETFQDERRVTVQ